MKGLEALAATFLLGMAACTGEPQANDSRQQTSTGLSEPDVRYEPSPRPVVHAMLRLAEVAAGDILYDLGSGDGRIPITATRDYGARAVGIDIDPKLVAVARSNARKAGVGDRVTFRNEDLFEADFSDATVVTLFLYPDVNLKLRPRLLSELRPGTRVVSHHHDMGDWTPDRTINVMNHPIYLWTIPAPGASR